MYGIYLLVFLNKGFPGGSLVKNLAAMQEPQETWVWSLDWEDPLEEGMATHCSILLEKPHGQRSLLQYSPGETPWTEEPGGLQSIGVQRVGHNWGDLACIHTLFRVLRRTILPCLWSSEMRSFYHCNLTICYSITVSFADVLCQLSFHLFLNCRESFHEWVLDFLKYIFCTSLILLWSQYRHCWLLVF